MGLGVGLYLSKSVGFFKIILRQQGAPRVLVGAVNASAQISNLSQ